MPTLKPWLTLAAVWLGHCGFFLFCVNRINATGFSRRIIKGVEKTLISICILLPIIIAAVDGKALWQWLWADTSWWPSAATSIFEWYGPWCVACCLVLGILWLESRLWLIPPRLLQRTTATRYSVNKRIASGSYMSRDARWLGMIPFNQIGEIEVNQKTLLLPRRVLEAEGLRIGHISDLHFTGQLHPDHYRFVIQQLKQLRPDLIILSGDIIDFDRCSSWVSDLLAPMEAPLGCCFVLGNHDQRLSNPRSVADQLQAGGWYDLGQSDRFVSAIERKLGIQLLGTERPWFDRKRAVSARHARTATTAPHESELRIAVSHSPDQIHWARRQACDLMFAGHTHGGQIRVPLVGPLVAPSWYGSKFASGVFYLHPTVMHVSRGVAGIHPLRFRCCPEVSLIVLTNRSKRSLNSVARY